MSESISQVEVTLNGKQYALLADWGALQRLERYFGGVPWYKVMDRTREGLTIDDTAKVLAALAVDRNNADPKVFLAAMAGPRGQLRALKGFKAAMDAGLPGREQDDAEGGDDANADPQ